MKRRLLLTLAAAVIIAAAAFGGGAYLISYALQPDGTHRPDSETLDEVAAEYPHIAPWLDSLRRTGALRDTVITGGDGVQLRALYAAAPVPTGRTAIPVHGYTGNATGMLMIGYIYNSTLGYNILLPDLRYHGASGGEAIQMGWLDRKDVIRWSEVANDLFGGETRQVIHGISMGAATTMMVAGEDLPPYIRCFVEDCGYTDVWSQFRKELKGQFGLPPFPLLHAASTLCKWRFGWSFREASALRQVEKCGRPMMFIHGAADDYVPTEMVYPLYGACRTEKELWIVPEAAHAVSYRDNAEEYTRRVGSFVEKHI